MTGTPLERLAASHGVTVHQTDAVSLLPDRVYALAVAIESDVFDEAPALRITRFLASAVHMALIDPPTIAQPDRLDDMTVAAPTAVALAMGAVTAPHRTVINDEGDVYAGLTCPKE